MLRLISGFNKCEGVFICYRMYKIRIFWCKIAGIFNYSIRMGKKCGTLHEFACHPCAQAMLRFLWGVTYHLQALSIYHKASCFILFHFVPFQTNQNHPVSFRSISDQSKKCCFISNQSNFKLCFICPSLRHKHNDSIVIQECVFTQP